MNILAPVDDIKQIPLFHYAGATEFYCGYLPRDWFEQYNKNVPGWTERDVQLSLNRREIGFANIASRDALQTVINEAHACSSQLYLTVNAPSYPEVNYPFIADYVSALEELGVDGYIVSDIGLLHHIRDKVHGKLILSTCNQIASADGVKFVQQLGVQRVVFPRYISLKQLADITNSVPDMEYECFLMEGKCVYDDGNCNILHSCGSFCAERWFTEYYTADGRKNTLTEYLENEDEYFEFTSPYPNTKLPESGWRNMGCGICALEYIVKNVKLDSVKIAGRGLGNRQKLLNIAILKKALAIALDGADKRELKEYMKKYQPWSGICNKRYRCYFPDYDT